MAQYFSGPTTFTSPAQINDNNAQFASALGAIVSQNNNKRDNRNKLLAQGINEGGDLLQQAMISGGFGMEGEGQRDVNFLASVYEQAYDPQTGKVDYNKARQLASQYNPSGPAGRLGLAQLGPRTTFLTNKDQYNITRDASDRDPNNFSIEDDVNQEYGDIVGGAPNGQINITERPIPGSAQPLPASSNPRSAYALPGAVNPSRPNPMQNEYIPGAEPSPEEIEANRQLNPQLTPGELSPGVVPGQFPANFSALTS